MLTEEEKKMIVEIISQLQFKVGDSAIAQKFETIVEKLSKESTK